MEIPQHRKHDYVYCTTFEMKQPSLKQTASKQAL